MKLRLLIAAVLLAAAAGGYWLWHRAHPAPLLTAALPDPANTLYIALGAEPGTLDPALARTLPETLIVLALFEGLFAFDPRTLEPRPALAESATTSSDGRTWTFGLREGRWTNGDRVTAEDFVSSWERARSPSLRAPYAHLLAPIQSAKAQDARTLIVETQEPTPWLPALLCLPPFLPVHRATVESIGTAWTLQGRMVSNGPFTLVSRRWHDSILLGKSSTWRAAAEVRLSGVKLLTSIPSSRAVDAFDAGEVDWVWSPPPARVAALSARKEWLATPRLSVRFLRFNTTGAPFREARLRRAVTLALDRVELARPTAEAPAHSFVPPGFPGYDPPTLEPDAKEALRLLDDAGYPRGAGLPQVELVHPAGETVSRLAKAIAARLRATMGMDVHVVALAPLDHELQEREVSFRHMSLSLRGADVLDPHTLLAAFGSNGPENRTGWRSPWYDELVTQATLATDPSARMDLYRQAERVLVQDEAAIAPLTFPQEGFLLRPRVKGVWANGLGVHPLRDVWLEPGAGDQ